MTPGPFPVGHTTFTIAAANNRPSIGVDVWYPSKRSAGPKATYQLIPGVDLPALIAVDGADPDTGSFPLAVYSHGGGGFSVAATFFTEVLASHGYVVAAPDHPGDTIIDAALGTNNTDYPSNVANRISDLGRVITAITTHRVSIPAAISRMVNTTRIVASGHSLGGAAAIGLAAADPRVGEVIAMDPTRGALTSAQLARVTVPVLMLWSTNGISSAEPEVFDAMHSPWFQVELPTAHHLGFTDLCSYQPFLAKWTTAIKKADPTLNVAQDLSFFDFQHNCQPPTISPARLHDLVDGYSLAFLNYTLLGEAAWKKVLETSTTDAQFTSGGSAREIRRADDGSPVSSAWRSGGPMGWS